MKKILFLFYIFITSYCCAQNTINDTDDDTVELKKNFFVMSYFVDQNYRMVYTDNGIVDGYQKYSDSPELKGYSTFCGWAKQFNKHIVSDIGIEYTFKRLRTNTLYFPVDTTGMKEAIALYTNNVSFVTIPISVSFAIGKKLKFGVQTGIAPKFKISDSKQFFKGYHPYYGIGSNSLILPTKSDNFNIEYRVSAFIEYNFKQTKMRLAPIYRIDLMNTYKKVNLKNAHSMGIGFIILV
ncbi:MAG: hypothetical protein WBM13_11515 [Bacteroidia bacterium]